MPYFLIRLHSDTKPVTETADRMFFPHLHGPYETEKLAQTEMAVLAPGDKEARFLLLEGRIGRPADSPLEKPEALKRAPGDENNWIQVEPLKWICKECRAVIQAVQVAHPIHSASMPGAGSGRCEYEEVGYCPNCEKKPNFNGAPIIGEP